jgi:hypothetical protein
VDVIDGAVGGARVVEGAGPVVVGGTVLGDDVAGGLGGVVVVVGGLPGPTGTA